VLRQNDRAPVPMCRVLAFTSGMRRSRSWPGRGWRANNCSGCSRANGWHGRRSGCAAGI